MYVSHVGKIDLHLFFHRFDVEQVASVFGDHRIDDGHVSPQVNELDGQIAAYETQAARDEAFLPFE
jgi:hypothetical protein